MKREVAYLSLLMVALGVYGWSQSGGGTAVSVPFVILQGSTPGSQQTGHINVSGTIIGSQHVGGGAGLTNLNASSLQSGTVPNSRLGGAYAGITGVGTLTSGLWNASLIGSGFGGLGLNTSATPTGSILYTSSTGSWATRPIGTTDQVLKVAGGVPAWGADSLTLPYFGSSTAGIAFSINATNLSDVVQLVINNPSSAGECLEVATNGIGDGLRSIMTGSGRAGVFETQSDSPSDCVQITNLGNANGLNVTNIGSGNAARFAGSGGEVEVAGPNGAIHTNGFLYREYTSGVSSAAIPIAYGSIAADGTINSGTGNFSVNRVGAGVYDITVDGEVYSNNTFTVNVSPVSNAPRVSAVADGGTPFRVNIWNMSSTLTDNFFHFTIWKANPSTGG